MELKPDILIEDLVENFPGSVGILREHHLVCIRCGEAVWGTLEELAKSKNLTDEEIQQILDEIKAASHPSLFQG